MDTQRRYRINAPKVIHETFDGEQVIINLDTGIYYSLDKIGSSIWGMLAQGNSVVQVIRRTQGSFRGDAQEIERSVSAFIAQLEAELLIIVSGDLPSGGADTIAEPCVEKNDFTPPVLQKFTDMQDLLLLDPIHEVDEKGWPSAKKDFSGTA